MRTALSFLLGALGCQAAEKPHILYILVDDYGWADAGWHRPPGYKEIQTPTFDSLIQQGIELDRHYVFKFCSPTRSAVQSGRNPINVNVLNVDPTYLNPEDPVSGYASVPRNMTGMAEQIKKGGYNTHMYGKWDAGMATPQHTPKGRGYDDSMFYFHHANDYWTYYTNECEGRPIVDLYHNEGPGHGLNNSKCSQTNQEGCTYEDTLFADQVIKSVGGWKEEDPPLFIFWAPHIVHAPLQVPQPYVDKFSFINDPPRQMYHAMVNFVDTAVGNVTSLLHQKGMWNNTLIVLHADNGGPIYKEGTAGANNYPLKGGKVSNWEGGIRVNAFVSGGYLPEKVRGTKKEGYICGWDWYTTLSHVAGVVPVDEKASKAGLPDIDGMNMWPYLSGDVDASPRTRIPIGDNHGPNTIVGGLIDNQYKILVGNLSQSGWTGLTWPNETSSWDPSTSFQICGVTPETGCLFNIIEDPGEHNNLAALKDDIFKSMLSNLTAIKTFTPNRGEPSPAACREAAKNGDYWVPFAHLDSE
eukprot:TRINITY_DN1710_c0_g1_i5.p1 TRINITY_DN1710_c0_g1~~TRINITY_DN1710_c0_g1_i5.p1  ORF type:complete len:526 (+),score=134.78 TRINITY_DN1710_c0_g1_i5:465-2042(+)